MADLSEDQVRAMGEAAGLPLDPDDLPEVTIRVNALIEGLRALDALPLTEVLPLVTLPHPEVLP